jgi:hypothetical protein
MTIAECAEKGEEVEDPVGGGSQAYETCAAQREGLVERVIEKLKHRMHRGSDR